jgi:hypothetical protein
MNNGQALADFLSVSTTYYGWSDLEEHLRQFWSMEFDDRPFKNNASKVTDLLKRIGLVERRGPHLFTDAYTFADLISKVEDDEDILFLNQPVDLSRPMKASLLQKQAYGEYMDVQVGDIRVDINLIYQGQPKTASAQTIGDKVSEFIKAHSGNSVTYNEWKTFCKDVAGDRADQLHRLIMKMDLAWEGPDYGTMAFQWWDPDSPLLTKVTDVFEEEAEHDKVNYTPEKEEEAIILLTSPTKQGSRKVAAIAGYINMVFLGKTLRYVRVGAVGNTIWYHIPVMDLMGITVDIDGGWYNIQTPHLNSHFKRPHDSFMIGNICLFIKIGI